MKIKLLLLIITITASSTVFAKHYYRFWRGHIAQEMTEVDFVKGLNKIFIPETVEQGKNDGLNSYLPVLISRNKSLKAFPDELALVVYDSEEKYRAIREMPRGANYQRMHWEYFNKENSRSRVPQVFSNEIQIETAYDLLESDADWQKGRVQFLVRKFKKGFTIELGRELKAYFNKIRSNAKDIGVESHIVLIDQLGSYEYILYKKGVEPRAESQLSSKKITTEMNIILSNSNNKIGFNEGVNRQFTNKKTE